jgi:hypothetical protein
MVGITDLDGGAKGSGDRCDFPRARFNRIGRHGENHRSA